MKWEYLIFHFLEWESNPQPVACAPELNTYFINLSYWVMHLLWLWVDNMDIDNKYVIYSNFVSKIDNLKNTKLVKHGQLNHIR